VDEIPDVPPDEAPDETGDADAEDEGDDGGGTGTLTVLVTGPVEWPDYDPAPVEGALVAFDAPGGARTEATTDAAGHATFDGFDWSAGTASVTAWHEGYGLASLVGLDGSVEEVTVELTNVDPWPRDGWVEVSGTVLNPPAGALAYNVFATVPSVWYGGAGPGYSLTVPPDTSFTLVATSSGTSQNWLLVDQDPVTAATTVDLDFATPAPFSSVTGSFPMPTRTDSLLRRGTGQVNVQWSRRPNGHGFFERVAYIGYATHTPTVSADGNSIEYEIGWTPPSWAVEPATRFNMLAGSGTNMDPSSSAWVDGYPTEGAQDIVLLDAPRMVTPSSPSDSHPIHDPIEWELFDTGVQVELQILRENGYYAPLTELWAIRAPVDATSITVPQLPSGVDYFDVLGSSLLQARVRIVTEAPTEPCYFRMATSMRFILEGDVEPPPCSADLREWFGTTETCWQCTAENCCAEAETLDAARDDYDAYVALALCSATNCNAECPPAGPCGTFGMPGLLSHCAECTDASCCDELGACRADATCSACFSDSYDPVTCCANATFAAFAGCLDTSCADECESCVDCHCPP
jgi:hypothetical protein